MLPALINRTCTNPQLNYMRNRWTKWVDTVCCRKYPLAVPLIHNQRASTFQCVSDNIHQHSYYEQPFPLPFIYANTMTNTWWCLTLKIVLRWIQTGHNESLIYELYREYWHWAIAITWCERRGIPVKVVSMWDNRSNKFHFWCSFSKNWFIFVRQFKI